MLFVINSYSDGTFIACNLHLKTVPLFDLFKILKILTIILGK